MIQRLELVAINQSSLLQPASPCLYLIASAIPPVPSPTPRTRPTPTPGTSGGSRDRPIRSITHLQEPGGSGNNDVHGRRVGLDHHRILQADPLPHRDPKLSRGTSNVCQLPRSNRSLTTGCADYQLDIEGLNITVTSAAPDARPAGSKGKARAKASKSDGTEILSNAKLRLKAGSRYALVGRNGSGKSSESVP